MILIIMKILFVLGANQKISMTFQTHQSNYPIHAVECVLEFSYACFRIWESCWKKVFEKKKKKHKALLRYGRVVHRW